MEAGPAAVFTDGDFDLSLEPDLPDGFDKVDIGELAHMDSELGPIENDLTTAHDFLNGVAEDFATNIAGVQAVLDTDLANPAGSVPDAILSAVPEVDVALEGAIALLPADAYADTAPTFEVPPQHHPPAPGQPQQPPGPSTQ